MSSTGDICWERDDGRHLWADGADVCLACGVDWEHRAEGGPVRDCVACGGTGWGSLPDTEDCPRCGGRGVSEVPDHA